MNIVRQLMPTVLKHALRPYVQDLVQFASGPSWERGFRLLKRHGFYPKTVFDIGVADGTPRLYQAYPDAFYYLIDPTADSLPHMRRLAKQLRCEILNLALGDRDGEVAMEIRHDIQGATLFEEVGPRDFRRIDKVPMRRFDQLVGEFERPALCKIDVQGAEMLVLRGMEGRMRDIDAFIVEASVLATLKDGPEVSEMVQYMKRQGFVIFEILGLTRRPLDGALAQADLLFVPDQCFLRLDRRWNDKA